ncbi:MAG: NifB/NifX family molybdenum-iron cluster-binding protein [Promethearchaeota archaeon]
MRRIAIPVNEQSGLDARISGHFGSSSFFLLIEIDDNNNVIGHQFISNPPHSMGGCMMPVRLLENHGVDILIVNGIGMRPMMGFRQVGIDVVHNNNGYVSAREIIENLEQLPVIEQSTCGGGRGFH